MGPSPFVGFDSGIQNWKCQGQDGRLYNVHTTEHIACLCGTGMLYEAVCTKLIGGMRTDVLSTNGQGITGQGLMPRVLGLLDLLAYRSGHGTYI